MVEDRFKVQQINIRLEEIISTTSYFLDRTHDILKTLQGRMTWVETNKESPTDVSIKDLEMIKLEYKLIEFASKSAEELLKTAMEQKVDIEPLRKHALMHQKRIHQMQLQMVEERFKVQ